MKAVFGKYLDVDLENRKITEYNIPNEWYKKYIGGRGIGARILLQELEGNEDSLGSKNILIFATGPFQGLDIPGSSRIAVLAISPKTKSISDSFAGGNFGGKFGKTGYDGIIFRKSSKSPVYLSIIEGRPELQDASEIWGMETGKVDGMLREKYGNKISTAIIGPAGENLVSFSSIIFDRRDAAARPGFGAVMGAKNLKAVVVKGHTQKSLYNKETFKEARKKFVENLQNDEITKLMGKYGTALDVGSLNAMSILPTKNFQKGIFNGADKLKGEIMYDTILVGREACRPCSIRCKRIVETEFENEKVVRDYGGPEYETIAAFGSNLLIDDLKFVALANQKCNALGLDTIGTGVTLAYTMEAVEKGILDLDISWGKTKGLINLIEQIAYKKGIGKRLANGVMKLEKEFDTDFAMQIKGQEVPMHEPRGKKGLGIDYATSPRGATHLEGFQDPLVCIENAAPELGIKKGIPATNLKDKPKYVKIFDDLMSFINSAILCVIVCNRVGKYYNMHIIRDMLNSATGLSIDTEEMLLIGERGYNLLKIGAAIAGYSKSDDDLPKRMKYHSFTEGPISGQKIPDEDLRSAIDTYYQIRGFDRLGPTNKTLEKLGMEEFKPTMERIRSEKGELS